MTRPASARPRPLPLTTPTYLLRDGSVWAVSSFRALRRKEGHVSSEHVLLAHSEALTAAYRHSSERRCQLTPDRWFRRRAQSTLVRIHSECMLSEVFGFDVCDCRQQLIGSMAQIVSEGEGVIVYLRQEGRGIGLAAKLGAMAADYSLDTYERNTAVGYPEDSREYGTAAAILRQVGLARVRLITDSPWKVAAMSVAGISVDERISLHYDVTTQAAGELLAKKRRGYSVRLSVDELQALVRSRGGCQREAETGR